MSNKGYFSAVMMISPLAWVLVVARAFKLFVTELGWLTSFLFSYCTLSGHLEAQCWWERHTARDFEYDEAWHRLATILWLRMMFLHNAERKHQWRLLVPVIISPPSVSPATPLSSGAFISPMHSGQHLSRLAFQSISLIISRSMFFKHYLQNTTLKKKSSKRTTL